MKNGQRPHIQTHKQTMAAHLYSAATKEDWLLELCRVQSNDNDSKEEAGLTPLIWQLCVSRSHSLPPLSRGLPVGHADRAISD